MTPFHLTLVICAALGLMVFCFSGLVLVMADGPVFTRAAFADLRHSAGDLRWNLTLMASGAVQSAAALAATAKGAHRVPREPLRARLGERYRRWAAWPERLADLSQPLPHERVTPRKCTRCRDEGGNCTCPKDCGEIQCAGVRQP